MGTRECAHVKRKAKSTNEVKSTCPECVSSSAACAKALCTLAATFRAQRATSLTNMLRRWCRDADAAMLAMPRVVLSGRGHHWALLNRCGF